MKFTMLGSGGAIRIPKACCSCAICKEARQKGFPYKRLGQSLYLHEGDILFDTPEDINEGLNIHKIENIDYIFYSHWHPDHTLGCRIIETIMDCKVDKKPIEIYMPNDNINIAINDNQIFDYYNSLEYCNINIINDAVEIGNIIIKRIELLNGFSYAYLLIEGNKRVLYCPCHSMHIPYLPELYNIDLLIVSKGYSIIKNKEYSNFERDTIRVVNELSPKRVILTHIEETDGLGYDEYKNIEKNYKHLEFGYDGLVINV